MSAHPLPRARQDFARVAYRGGEPLVKAANGEDKPLPRMNQCGVSGGPNAAYDGPTYHQHLTEQGRLESADSQ